MREISFVVNILFFKLAKEKYNFPLNNSIRVSFWLSNSPLSTFSEIRFNDEKIELNKDYEATITLVERDFLKGKLLKDSNFKVGVYPEAIGQGTIIKIV